VAVSGPSVDYVAYVEARLAWLRRLAYLLCQDWHSADDLVQVTVTRLYMHWPRAARMDNIDGYVRTILVRTFLGERRSPWFRRVLLAGVQADGVAVGPDPDAVLDVREALAAIPPRQRATLVLRFYCDLDVEQAAIALGCSAGTVRPWARSGWWSTPPMRPSWSRSCRPPVPCPPCCSRRWAACWRTSSTGPRPRPQTDHYLAADVGQ
jgi:DNA-directed RNA polymerase specialized sigma24 family protein